MTGAHRGILDTSVLIAREAGRPLDEQRIPDLTAITVITEAEIRAGVVAAGTVETRSMRLRTLERLSDVVVLPADSAAAEQWARLRGFLAERQRRMRVNDLWIAAIAASRGLPVVTQDADFDALAGAAGVAVIRV